MKNLAAIEGLFYNIFFWEKKKKINFIFCVEPNVVFVFFYWCSAAVGHGSSKSSSSSGHSSKNRKAPKNKKGGLSPGQSNWSTSEAHRPGREEGGG